MKTKDPAGYGGARLSALCQATGTGGMGEISCAFGPDLLTQHVDRHRFAVTFKAPVGPAVAGRRVFQMRANLMDRAFDIVADQRSVCTNLGLVALVHGIKLLARAQHPAFDQLAKRDARFGAFAGADFQRFAVELAHLRDALLSHLAIAFLAFNADELAPQHLGDGTGRASAKERVKDHIARIGRANQYTVQQRFRLLRRMRLVTVFVFEAFVPGADRQYPVAAHLHAFVQRFQRFVVERVLGTFALGRPDHRLMRVGEPLATEIRHRVRFAPDDVVQNPVPSILQGRTHAENVVVRPNHPDRAIRLQQTMRGLQPFARELVIDTKARELIPVIIDRIDLRIIGRCN